MKKYLRIFTVAMFSVVLFLTLVISVNADYYEPDGSSSTEYLFASSECNKSVVVNCVDQSGKLIKKVTYHTKQGEDGLISLSLYGYDIIAFSSNQGLWETCSITWCSGTGFGESGYVQIRYCFRNGWSTNVLTATVTVRKSEAITYTIRHYIQKRDQTNFNYKYYSLYDSTSKKVDYYTQVSASAKTIAGYTLKSEYVSNISGKLSYTWIGMYENIPYDNFEYDFVNTSWSEDMGEYETYDENRDGKLDYCINRVYYIDFYYDLDSYTVSFDPNGGSGAPESIKKYYGLYIEIPETIPTRNGYDFLGWGTYASDTSVDYSAGDQFDINANTTLYAIWDQYDYEFSVGGLDVVRSGELLPNTTVIVSVHADSWDQYDPQPDIPMSLYYDGRLLRTVYVDFEAYGAADLDFALNVGSSTGLHTIEVRINWDKKNIEVNPNNNSVSTTINVISDSYDFSIKAQSGNGAYKEGLEVITSFLIYNNSARQVLPSAGTSVEFSVYFYCSAQKVVLEKQTWDELVIPVKESNLVYFRWTVHDGLAGNTVYCECTVNYDGKLKEGDLSDNKARLTTTVSKRNESQTANPTYEAKAPTGFTTVSTPNTKTGSVSWSLWEYNGEVFVKRSYGLQLETMAPGIEPGATCESAYYSNGKWTMKSGYGITVEFDDVSIESLSGYTMPSKEDYTDIQSIYATFPEFRYSISEGKYRALEYKRWAWRFVENEGADSNERLHYIPVWYDDGYYTVAVTVTDVWTPAGVVTAVLTSNRIIIEGNVFDDFYVGG